MNSVFERLKRKGYRDLTRYVPGDTRNFAYIDGQFSHGKDEEDSSFDLADGITHKIDIRKARVIANNIDLLLNSSSGLAFFIHYLEFCEKVNLIKFWIHVEGYKMSFGEQRSAPLQKAEQSLALLDARNIYNKYIDEESVSSIAIPKTISKRVFDKLSEQRISPDVFDEAKDFIHGLFESRYFKQFEESLFYKKYQLQELSRCCALEDVLHLPPLLNSFLEFVDNRYDHNCLQFLIACNTFETNYETLSDKEALEDAISIYDKYFSMQALTPLNIEDDGRRTMESEICSASGRPLKTSFCSAKEVCSLRIHERYLRRFVRSAGYHNYLIELEADIQNTIELPQPNREALVGSSSSGSMPIVFDKHFDVPEFEQISIRSSHDSPSLKRSRRSISLAEVDCMGQYHVLYDDSLAKEKNTTPSRIRQKLRKYLDKATLKEEEIALEVARTIIADVYKMVEAGRK